MVEGVGDMAVVFAFFKVVLADVHFSDDSLETDKFIAHSAVKASGGDEVGSEITLYFDVVSLILGRFIF